MPDHHSLSDELCLLRMDLLTLVGKRVLPEGIWRRHPEPEQTLLPDTAANKLFLTFDDGPCPHTTPGLLELLEELNVKATFFLLGSQVARHPQLVEQIARMGHTIGNHTYNHHLMPMLSIKSMEKEIGSTNDRIKEASGYETKLFRPPFGLLDRRGAASLKERTMTPVYWGAVAEDWAPIGADRVVSRVLRRISDGNLIVLHEGKSIAAQTIDATREIIKQGIVSGYRFEPIV